MSPDDLYTLLAIAVVAAVTLFTRVLPFAIFGTRKAPQIITYLGDALPVAIITILVIYCLKGINFTVYPYGLPELIAAAIVVVLHVWKHNVLVSIFSGTAVYMALIQVVF